MNIQIQVSTSKRNELKDITAKVAEVVEHSGVKDGICMVYVPHTTAAVTINEGADPDVKHDILDVLSRLVPFSASYRHAEGNSDAHVKSVLVGNSGAIHIEKGRLCLGTWQAIFFCEFDGPRSRRVIITVQ